MKKLSLIALTMFMVSNISLAKESSVEKAETIKNQSVDAAQRNVRASKDKLCETFNEKGECVGQKINHEAKNLQDSTATKAQKIKNKID